MEYNDGAAAGDSFEAQVIFNAGVIESAAADDNATIFDQQEFLEDLFDRRGVRSGGWNPIWFAELEGATIIIPTAFEPDPNTHRGDYYYNANSNALYKKVISRNESGIIIASWHKTSQ